MVKLKLVHCPIGRIFNIVKMMSYKYDFSRKKKSLEIAARDIKASTLFSSVTRVFTFENKDDIGGIAVLISAL